MRNYSSDTSMITIKWLLDAELEGIIKASVLLLMRR